MNTTLNNTTEERQTSAFDYKVELVPLITTKGDDTRFFGTRRQDSGEVFGCVTKHYEVIQNAELFGAAEDLFARKGLLGWRRKAVITHGGARARAVYDFPTMGAKVAKGDIQFRLTVQNSFDGSLRASFKAGLFRVVCSNGMAVCERAENITRKHTSGFDKSFAALALNRALDSFHGAIPAFQRMSEMPVSQSTGDSIIEALAKRKVLAERMGEHIKARWAAPTYREDEARNLFNLYNAFTQHLTHEVENRADKPRFELSERVNERVTARFVEAARNGNLAALLN